MPIDIQDFGHIPYPDAHSRMKSCLTQRIAGEAWWLWGFEGTLGLVIFMSGLGFFGSSIRYLVLKDLTDKAQE